MKKINESFECINCKKIISPAQKTCRNHCPYCFASLHVDGKIPGDRDAACQGIMLPIQYELKNGDLKIQFKCSLCEKIHRNKKATDDQIDQLDDSIKNFQEKYPTIYSH
ncbi:MAG TPA: RNHCP domain-containing protein [Candidatus Absconditabacterales bacterium]|nr:RNHCP domain-containing protein [Candidatus Absconditabacterales bacterium]HMT27633.1 RNHCP domain-containing protein [Candidatus Absconditabacterales bacterium]